ncbi:MFS transporter [Paraburkholderia nemoris]|uniref:MFS transporter n=1 Tax=Paraburkholderia nemoris TaxID=2793076 RepID=UPI0038B97722
MKPVSKQYENILMLLLFFAVGFMFLDRLSINFLFPFMRSEFALTNLKIGLLTSCLSLAWAASGFVVSAFADANGKRKSVLIFMILVFSIGSIFSGLASSFFLLLAARALMGFAEGPVLPISQSLMMMASSESRRGFNMGFVQASAAGLLGAVVAPAILVPLADKFGWRAAFFTAGIPGLIIALLIFLLVREPSCQSDLSSAITKSDRTDLRYGDVVRNKNIVICTVMSCMVITWFLAVVTFAPAYLMEHRNFTASQMGLVMTILGVSTVIGGSAVPWLSDRIGRKYALFLFLMVGIFSPLTIPFLETSLASLCIVIGFVFLGYGCFPIVLATVPAESVPAHYVSRALATVMGISEIIGGVVSPTAVGMLSDRFGSVTPFVIASICSAFALGASLFLKETAPLKNRAPSAKIPPKVLPGKIQ